MKAAVAQGSHVIVRGIPQRTAGRNGAIVEQQTAIATPSHFGVVLMQLIAAVEATLGGVSAADPHSEPCGEDTARSFFRFDM